MDWSCHGQGRGNCGSVTPPCHRRFRWELLAQPWGCTGASGVVWAVPLCRLNLGSVRKKGKDGGCHCSWQPWERDPGVSWLWGAVGCSWGAHGRPSLPAGHEPVGNIPEEQWDMQQNHPVLVPSPCWCSCPPAHGRNEPDQGLWLHRTAGCAGQETPLPLPAVAPRPALPGSLPAGHGAQHSLPRLPPVELGAPSLGNALGASPDAPAPCPAGERGVGMGHLGGCDPRGCAGRSFTAPPARPARAGEHGARGRLAASFSRL